MIGKALFVLVISTLPCMATALEFELNFEQQCDYKSGSYVCKKISGAAPLKQLKDGTFVTSAFDAPQYPLRVIKDDENILVLEYDTSFSGTRILYVMKKTMSFHWTEIAYSQSVGEGVHYKRGSIILK